MLIGFFIFAVLLWSFSFLMMALGTCLTLRHLHPNPNAREVPINLPGISILKPLKGADAALKENLRSFFEIDYPEFEILFSVASLNDPARAIAEELMLEFSHVNARLIKSGEDIGLNPKINNLFPSYDLAQNDWVVISDSNVRVNKNYLYSLVRARTPNSGIVTALVAGTNPLTSAAEVEAVYLNTFYARSMTLAAAFGFPCVLGKSMFFSRSIASRFGGLRSLAPFLAEDYMAGIAMKRLGFDVTLMREPVDQYIGSYEIKDFWRRHIRWGRIRKAQAPIAFFFESTVGSVVAGVFGAIGLHHLFGISSLLFLSLHFLFWCLGDFLIANKMNSALRNSFLSAWIIRELIAFPLWLFTACGNSVFWRGRKLQLKRWGVLENLAHV